MQLKFILGECPSGWLNAGELGGCYLFSPDGPGINWDQARAFCESVGGFLTDILNQETQDFIDESGFFQSYPNVNWWIGANDIANVSHAITNIYLFLHIQCGPSMMSWSIDTLLYFWSICILLLPKREYIAK